MGPARKALEELGLSADQVSRKLSQEGLQKTLAVIEEHLAQKFPGAAGMMQEHLQKVKDGVETFDDAMSQMALQDPRAVALFADIVGGTRGIQAGLELSGPHMKDFINNVNGMDAASKGAGKTMEISKYLTQTTLPVAGVYVRR